MAALGLLPVLLGASGAAAPGDVALEMVANGFELPVFVIGDPSRPSNVLVVELGGIVRLLVDGAPASKPFLNIKSRVAMGTDEDEEYGLFSLAFDPKWPKKRFVYVNYINSDGNTVISRFTVNKSGTQAKANTERVMRTIVQPRPWHNGGQLQVGPDKYLYVGMGDGGDDADSGRLGQDLTSLHGKILRFKVANKKLKVPKSNPVLPGVGRTAIYIIGVRNPWRFSFDRETGDILIGDVGEDAREEISHATPDEAAGMNLGWPVREGSIPFNNGVAAATTPLVGPIYEYNHGQGQSVTGGYVYRGSAIPDLNGYYVFGDWASARIWAFELKRGKAKGLMDLSGALQTAAGDTPTVSSFGEDANGEIYVCDFFAGTVYKIVPAS